MEQGHKEEKLIILPYQSLIEFQYVINVDNKQELKLNIQSSSTESEHTKDFESSNNNDNTNRDSIEPQSPEKISVTTQTKSMINKLISPRMNKSNLISPTSITSHNNSTNINKKISFSLRSKNSFNSLEHTYNTTSSNLKQRSDNEYINNIISSCNFDIITSSLTSLSDTLYDDNDYETLCEAAFVIGLPEDNSNLIPQSEKYPPNCQHKECSILSSFQPHILHFYLNPKHKNNSIEISDLTANMVFPLGISICFKGDNKSSWPHPYKPFLNIIRNAKGETYYLVCFHYFKHIPVSIFDSTYKVNPLKEYTKFMNMSPEKLEENLSIISSFIDSESFLIPECIALVSRFPFINQLLVCLESIYNMNQNDINNVINHIVSELPVPINNKLLMFYLPNNVNIIPLYVPTEPNEINLFSNDVDILELLSIDNIILVFHLILLEQKVLFINNNYHILSFALVEFVQLIYPLVWIDTIVPVLSLSTVQFLQSIIPFVMGIDEFLLQFSINNDYIDFKNDSIVFVDLAHNTISVNKDNKKTNKKNILEKLNIPDIPIKVYKYISTRLKELKKDKELYTNIKIKERIREIFCTAMIMMMGDYKRYLFYMESDNNVFNNESFLQCKKKEERSFYKELISTQVFSEFISNEKEAIKYSNCNMNKRKYDNVLYSLETYNELCKEYLKTNNEIKGNGMKIKKSKTNPLFKKESFPSEDNILKHNEGNKLSKILSSQEKCDSLYDMSKLTPSSKDIHSCKKEIINTSNEFDSNNNIVCKLFTNEENEGISNKNENILITPYFLKVPITNIKKSNIHSFIQSNIMKIYPSINDINGNYVSNYIHRVYNFDKIKDSYRRYYISKNINNDNTNETIPFKRRGLRKRSLSSDCLRIQPLSNIKDINEWFIYICTNNEMKLSQMNSIYELMSNYSNRECLANILIQEKDTLEYDEYIRNLDIKILTYNCLVELSKVVQKALEEIKGKYITIKLAKRFIICLFRYCALSKKENYFIFLYELIDTTKVYILTNFMFWKEWFEEEYGKYEGMENKEKKEEIVNGLLIGMSEFMFRLKLERMFIKNLIIDCLGKEYIEEEMQMEFEDLFYDKEEDIMIETKRKKKGK